MVVETTRRGAVPEIADQPDRRGLTLLGSGHFVVDMTVGALSPLLPVFKKAMGYLGLGPEDAGRLARSCLERGAVDLDLAPVVAEQKSALGKQWPLGR